VQQARRISYAHRQRKEKGTRTFLLASLFTPAAIATPEKRSASPFLFFSFFSAQNPDEIVVVIRAMEDGRPSVAKVQCVVAVTARRGSRCSRHEVIIGVEDPAGKENLRRAQYRDCQHAPDAKGKCQGTLFKNGLLLKKNPVCPLSSVPFLS
jgi:hypothetical protein